MATNFKDKKTWETFDELSIRLDNWACIWEQARKLHDLIMFEEENKYFFSSLLM